jgi:hypothetical protein
VVVDFMPHQLAAPPVDPELIRPWSELIGPRGLMELAWCGAEPSVVARLALATVLPSYRARPEVRAEARAVLARRPWHLGRWFRVLRRHWAVNRGSQASPPRDRPGAVDPRNPGLFPAEWRPDPRSLAIVRRFVRRAERAGATVFWLIPPIHPEGQALRERLGLDAAYAEAVRGLQARFPRLVVVDARRSGYPAERFRDAVHLDWRGAAALSAGIADVVARPRGPAGAWIALPPFREPSGIAPVEDLEASRIALNRRSATRR